MNLPQLPKPAHVIYFSSDQMVAYATIVIEKCAQIADDMDYSPDLAIGKAIRALARPPEAKP